MKKLLFTIAIITNVLTAESITSYTGRLSLEKKTWYLYVNEGRKELPQIKYRIVALPFDSARSAFSGLVVTANAESVECRETEECISVSTLVPALVEPLGDSDKTRISKLLKR